MIAKWPDFESAHNATTDALHAENERLRAALDRYGDHDDDCETDPWHGKGPMTCSCGFYQALANG
jgi:hypothetical protein